ncbi:MAG: hypothetical protein HC941_30760 [Microcoleus sp. SU_5_3]|nr:hypothetical protein [Microcoleus sp. SU_5_3]
MAPNSLSLLNSVVYSSLVKLGIFAIWNCEPFVMAKGLTFFQCGMEAGFNSGGMGCQKPGWLVGV